MPTMHKLWDGVGLPEKLKIPGHLQLRGSAQIGVGYSWGPGTEIKVSADIDGSVSQRTWCFAMPWLELNNLNNQVLQIVFDADYSGDKFANVMRGELFDMAFLVQATVAPIFEAFEIYQLDFSELLKGVVVDLYVVASHKDPKILIGTSFIMSLKGLCSIVDELQLVCDIISLGGLFDPDLIFDLSFHMYASSRGLGLSIGMIGEFAWLGWGAEFLTKLPPLALGMEISVEFELNTINICFRAMPFPQICTAQCVEDAGCGDGSFCMPLIGWCFPKIELGHACPLKDSACQVSSRHSSFAPSLSLFFCFSTTKLCLTVCRTPIE